MGISAGQFRKRYIALAIFIAYLFSLALFVFFPRPILESGDESAIAEFLQSHANIFYKILYADTRLVALANFFMLTPFVIIAHVLAPALRKRYLITLGFLISVAIEAAQRFIPGRVSDPRDLYSNVISVLIGALLIRFLHFTRKS